MWLFHSPRSPYLMEAPATPIPWFEAAWLSQSSALSRCARSTRQYLLSSGVHDNPGNNCSYPALDSWVVFSVAQTFSLNCSFMTCLREMNPPLCSIRMVPCDTLNILLDFKCHLWLVSLYFLCRDHFSQIKYFEFKRNFDLKNH